MISEFLLADLRDSVAREIEAQLTADFQARMRPLIDEAVKQIMARKVDYMRSLHQFEDKIALYLHWNDRTEVFEIRSDDPQAAKSPQ